MADRWTTSTPPRPYTATAFVYRNGTLAGALIKCHTGQWQGLTVDHRYLPPDATEQAALESLQSDHSMNIKEADND